MDNGDEDEIDDCDDMLDSDELSTQLVCMALGILSFVWLLFFLFI